MNRCFIFAAGTFFGLREAPVPGDLVIAADAGFHICQELEIQPDLVLGDFDSMPAPAFSGSVIHLPVEKDDTDTMAAVRTALENECKDIFIYGGTGGKRLDHTLANLQTLLFLRRQGAHGYLYDDDFIWTVIENESLTIPRTVDWGLVSVFCLGDRATGIDESGLQYTLENAMLTADFPMGVSNHILAEQATITVRSGALAVGWELPSLS